MEFSLQEQYTGFINTPQIFAENLFSEYPLFRTENSAEGKDLSTIVEPESRVLGKRMENFFHFYITHFSYLKVLAHNEQIISEKQTLGELDFLLKDPVTAEVSHVELIYKFYLYDPETGTSEMDHLIGPNKRDSLNRKISRLQKRQFPLLFNEATRQLLNSLEVEPEAVVQKMCFKAAVFLPRHRKMSFSEINNETLAGYWIKARDFTEEIYGKELFYSPAKKYWPVNPEQNQTWISYSEVRSQVGLLLKQQLSLLLWMKTRTGAIEKFFVVWW